MAQDFRCSPVGLFRGITRTFPDNVAVEDASTNLTYRQLDARSNALANRLIQSGANHGQVIPIITHSCISMIVGVLAILKVGAIYVPIDRSLWSTERVSDVLERINPTIVVTTGAPVDFQGSRVVDVDDDCRDWAADTPPEDPCIDPAELGCVIFTSGTTNKPKGVMVRNSSIAHFVSSSPFNYDVTPEDRVLLALSVAFDAFTGTLFNTLCNGGTAVLASGLNLQERVGRCSVFVGTPSMLGALMPPRSPSDYPNLDRIVLGGETPSNKLLQSWACLSRPIWIAYGPTEATCATLTGLVELSPEHGDFRPTVLGYPIQDATVTLVSPEMEEIDALDTEGELLISGPGLAKGYWQDAKQTSEKFILYNGVRTYRTGDHARWTLNRAGDKVIDFCGRKDRIKKVRGFLVNLDLDVDAALVAFDAGVQVAHSTLVDGALCTAVVPASIDTEDLRARWSEKAPSYLVPDHLFSLEKLPTTANGKIDARALESMVRDILEDVSEEEADGCDGFRDVVLTGLRRVLGVPTCSLRLDKSFVALGLHSLAATMLSAHCRSHGYSVPARELLTAPSVEAFLANSGTAATWKGSYTQQRPADSICEAPLTDLQLSLVYGSLRDAQANVVQYMATYHSDDVDRLRAAWEEIVRTEPIFHLDFQQKDGQYVQRLANEPNVAWSNNVLDSEDELDRVLQKSAMRAGLGSHFAVVHLRDRPSEAVLVWSVHHALIDGFSSSLILNKVQQVLRGEKITPSPPFTLAAKRLRDLENTQAMEAGMFWNQQEKLFPDAVGGFLVAKPTEAQGSGQAEHALRTSFDLDLLADYAQAFEVTPAAFHYAAWALVVSVFANSDTVVFGSVMSGRDLDSDWATSMIGPLLNTQPFRAKIDRDAEARTFVRQTHSAIHAVSKFHTSRSGLDPASFGSAIAIQYDSPTLDEAEIWPLDYPVVKESTGFPLNVLVERDGTLRFLYSVDRFSLTDVEMIGYTYENVLRELLEGDCTLQECLDKRFSRDMVEEILAASNAFSDASYVSNAPRTVTTLFEQAAAANSDRTAVEKGSAHVTYGEVSQAAEELASVITTIVDPGDNVCVMADRSISWIIGVFGVLKSSAVYCPLDCSHSPEYLAGLAESAGAKLVLCNSQRQAQEMAARGFRTLHIDEVLRTGASQSTGAPHRRDDPRAVAFLCFTSGSTGRPKGVMCEHGGIVAFHESLDVRLNSRPGVRIAQFLSPGFDGCVHEVLASLCYGATLVLRTDDHDPFSHLGSVDVAMMTPSVAAGLDPVDYPNLKYVYFAGEPVPQRSVERWAPGRALFNLYGPTEGTIGACQQRLKAGVPVSVGPPVPSTRLYILNDKMELLPPRVIGNIYIAGVQVSRGYINMPAQTRAEFGIDPFIGAGRERMYRTGDLGFFDEEGNVHCCGRKDRQIKLRGFRTNLDDIATVACQEMLTIKKAVAAQHKGTLVLWVEPECIDTDALRLKLLKVLPTHAIPKSVITMPALPLSTNGKVDAKKLVQLHVPTAQHKSAVRLSHTESLIAQEWRQLLGFEPSHCLSPYDGFMSLGGHSVLQLSLAARLKAVFKVPVTIRDVICSPTLTSLATLVEERQGADGGISEDSHPALGQETPSPPEMEWLYRYTHSEEQSTFNVPYVARLPDHIDTQRLAACLETVLGRHEILRSRFVNSGDGSVHRIIADDQIRVEMAEAVDISEFINRPFDPATGPLARACVSSSLMALCISHIVIDLTGLQTLLRETAALYHGRELGPVRRSYFDVTTWTKPTDSSASCFWQTYLQGIDLSRPRVSKQQKSYKGSSLVYKFPKALYDRLLGAVAKESMSLHQFGLAVAGIVLQTLMGDGCRRDVMLGAPYMNRTALEDQAVVGLFLEPMPVRVKNAASVAAAAGEASPLLRSVRDSSQAALAHAMPWASLLRSLGLPFPGLDDGNRHLFDCVVTFHDERGTHAADVFPIDAAVEPVPVWTQGSKFALLFEWLARPDALSVRLEFDADVLGRRQVEVVRDLVVEATESLLQPDEGGVGLVAKLNESLVRRCAEHDLDVEEFGELAREFLGGA